MKIKIKRLLKENLNSYSAKEIEKARIAIGLLIDSTLTKPTLDVNTFADSEDQIDKDRYKWFRDNPREYIDSYSGFDPDDEEYDFEKEVKDNYGPVRDPKQTSLLYYLYKGVYFKDGKWNISNGLNIEAVIKEIQARASAFVDAIQEKQLLIDVFFADWKVVNDNVKKYVDKESQPSIVSTFMSKGAPGEFKTLTFGKFRRGAMYGTTNTKGVMGTRDHMYKGTREFDNIPDEHKPYFLFDYIWQTCYNYAQADGLKQSPAIIEPKLDDYLFSLNYQDGLTLDEERKDRASPHPLSVQMSKASPKQYEKIMGLVTPILQAMIHPDKKVDPYTKALNEMTDDEIMSQMEKDFDDVLNFAKQSLKGGYYPSGMITLLRLSDKVPMVLLDKFETKVNRTIKGMEMAGYLDENGDFTDKVENKDVVLQESKRTIKVRIIGG